MTIGKAVLATTAALGLLLVGVVGGTTDRPNSSVPGFVPNTPAAPQAFAEQTEPPVVQTRRARVVRSGGRHIVVLRVRGAGSIKLATAGYGWATARPRLVVRLKPNVVARVTRDGSLTVGGYAERDGSVRARFALTLLPPEASTPGGRRTPDEVADVPSCNPNYTPCVPNISEELSCSDIGFAVRVTGSDPFRLDPDGDGMGCETM